MPQPLSKILPAERIDLIQLNPLGENFFASEERASWGAYVAQAIAKISAADLNLIDILALLIRQDHSVALTMFSAIISQDAQRAMIKSVARSVLHDAGYALFEAILKAIKPAQGRRNAFCHHIWMSIRELPNALLLVDPKEFGANRVSLGDHLGGGTFSSGFKPPDISQVMVYRENDFVESTIMCAKAHRAVLNFWTLLYIDRSRKMPRPIGYVLKDALSAEEVQIRSSLSAYLQGMPIPQDLLS